jgi:hypothetical protein
LLYAMKHAVPHLILSRDNGLEKEQIKAVERREDQIIELTYDEQWREQTFRTCGHAHVLREACKQTQLILYKRDGTQNIHLSKILQLSDWLHSEPHRLYSKQKSVIQNAVAKRKLQAHLEHLIELAQVGERTSEKILLVMTALWAQDTFPSRLPQKLKAQVQQWLEIENAPILNQLWNHTLEQSNLSQ